MVIRSKICLSSCQRPYHVEHTSSRPITEVKQHWAWIVLGWETAWELQVLLASFYVNLSLSYMEEVSKKFIVIFGHRLMICSKIAPLLWGHTHWLIVIFLHRRLIVIFLLFLHQRLIVIFLHRRLIVIFLLFLHQRLTNSILLAQKFQ